MINYIIDKSSFLSTYAYDWYSYWSNILDIHLISNIISNLLNNQRILRYTNVIKPSATIYNRYKYILLVKSKINYLNKSLCIINHPHGYLCIDQSGLNWCLMKKKRTYAWKLLWCLYLWYNRIIFFLSLVFLPFVVVFHNNMLYLFLLFCFSSSYFMYYYLRARYFPLVYSACLCIDRSNNIEKERRQTYKKTDSQKSINTRLPTFHK
jgi:hypothetical protein